MLVRGCVLALCLVGLISHPVRATQTGAQPGTTPGDAAKVAPAPGLGSQTLPTPSSDLAFAVERVLASASRLYGNETASPILDDELAEARTFYAARGAEPMWVTASGITKRGNALIEELRRADEWGLATADFQLGVFDQAAGENATVDALARMELALTGAALKYARHARGGRIPDPASLLSGFIDRRPQLAPTSEVLATLAAAPSPDKALQGYHPQNPQFELLRQAYGKARLNDQSEARLALPDGPSLTPGKSHPDVVLLRRRLGIATAAEGAPQLYDAALVDAVKAFQSTARLRTDGVVGAQTRSALNAGIAQTGLARLLANMELWRWMPAQLGATRIEVNIPEQTVRFIRDGNTIHSERVIIGKMQTATPIFSDVMRTVVFQPKWGVPDSIKINELLPDLLAGNGLKNGLKMTLNGRSVDPWNVDWRRADITKYMVFQPAGDDNALGAVKFLFPNKHAVYLHDTPNKRLFNTSDRLYSHGCVRVRNPLKLAQLILETDKGWQRDDIQTLVNDGPEDNAVKLESLIPVHLNYFTVTVDPQLNVQTAPDVYGHEKRVTLALEGRFNKIAKLDPKPVDLKAVTARAAQVARRQQRSPNDDGFGVRVNGRYAPPSALGYYAPVPQPWGFFSPQSEPARRGAQRPASNNSRYRGNTPNDVFMRAFGGF